MAQHIMMSAIPVITNLSLKTDPDQKLDHDCKIVLLLPIDFSFVYLLITSYNANR